jgi:hypothetical protein
MSDAASTGAFTGANGCVVELHPIRHISIVTDKYFII